MTKADKEGQRKAPILRFKGFTDDWEQRQLGDISEKRIEKNNSLSIDNILSNSAIYGIVKQTQYFDKTIANNIQNYYVVHTNDFIYNPRISNNAPFGPISRNKLAESGVMSPLYLVFYFSKKSLSDFFEIYFKSSKWHNFMYMHGNSGARSDRFAIKDDEFFKMRVKIPHNKSEIDKIYRLNILLNNLITLYDRKLKLLSQIKKYFLDNLFAKKEYPNLRFKGFTDAWEQRKLSSILIERKDLSTESKQFPLSSFIQEKGVVPKSQRYDRSFLVKDSSKKYKVTKFGDFIYSSNNLDTGSIGLNSYGNAVISPVYSVFSSKNSNILETNFVNLLFQQNFYKNKMLRFRQGVMYGQLKIKEDDFLKVKVNVPSQIEIKNIINLFSKIESYATLLENKKKQLVQIKNTLLNTMFI